MEIATLGTATQNTFEAVLERAKRLSGLREDKARWEKELVFAQRNVEALFKAAKVPADEFARINSQIKSSDEQISAQLAETHAAFGSWVRELEESNERATREIVLPDRLKLKSLLDEAAAICERLRFSRKRISDRIRDLNEKREILARETQEPIQSLSFSEEKLTAPAIPGIRTEDHRKGDLELILRSVSSQI